MQISSNDMIEVSDSTRLTADPTVSVIIITYNHADFLSEAIESIVTQVCDFEFEVIISEDCSSDNTRDVALALQKKHPNLLRILYSSNNIGPGANFQRALSNSRGDFIAICEGDDKWQDCTKLQKQIDFLKNNNDVVVTYHDAISVGQNGKLIAKSKIDPKHRNRDFSSLELQLGMHLPTLTMCFRKVFTTFPEEFYFVVNQDTFMISLLGGHGSAKYMDNIKPAYYRVHDGGIWSSLSKHQKGIRHITTFYWLSIYHRKVSNNKISSLYSKMAIKKLLAQIFIQRIDLVKVSLKWLLTKS